MGFACGPGSAYHRPGWRSARSSSTSSAPSWTGARASRRRSRRAGVPGDPAELADAWRERYRPILDEVNEGARPSGDFDELHLGDARRAARRARRGLAAAERAEPGAAPGTGSTRGRTSARGLEALRRDRVTATLSNGHVALLVDLARHGDLRFDCLLSAELARAYKPAPEVYRTAARLLGVEPASSCSSPRTRGTSQGAREAGLRTAFVDRPLEYGPGSPAREDPEADVSAGDLHELAQRLLLGIPPMCDGGRGTIIARHESRRTRPDALGPRHSAERPDESSAPRLRAAAAAAGRRAGQDARPADPVPGRAAGGQGEDRRARAAAAALPLGLRGQLPERRGPQARLHAEPRCRARAAAARPPASSPTSAPGAARIRTTRARSGSPAGAPATSSR